MKNAAKKTAAKPEPELAAPPLPAPAANGNDSAELVDDRTLEARTTITRYAWQQHRSKRTGPPFYKIGKRCLYKWNEVQVWIESHRREPKKKAS